MALEGEGTRTSLYQRFGAERVNNQAAGQTYLKVCPGHSTLIASLSKPIDAFKPQKIKEIQYVDEYALDALQVGILTGCIMT